MNITDNQVHVWSTQKVQIARALLWTRAPMGLDRSPEYNEHFCYKLDFLENQKALSMIAPSVKSVWKKQGLVSSTA